MSDQIALSGIPEPSPIVYGMPADEYRRGPGVSASTIKRMAQKTPAEVRHEIDNPKEETAALALGTVAHSAILEGDAVEQNYKVAAKPNLRSNAGKEEWARLHEEARAEGKTLVSQADWDKACCMRDSIHQNPIARKLLSAGRPEVTLYAEYEGELLRTREDWMPDGYNIVCDLKTDRDPGHWFGNDAFKLGYHIAAHQYRMVRHLVNTQLGADQDLARASLERVVVDVPTAQVDAVAVEAADAGGRPEDERLWPRG